MKFQNLQKKQNHFLLLLLLYFMPSFSFPCPSAFDADKKNLTLKEAKKVVRDLNIRALWELEKERKELGNNHEILRRIPLNLVAAYRDQDWVSFHDFFGTTHEWYLYRKLKAYFEELDLLNTVYNNYSRSDLLAFRYSLAIDHVFQYRVHNKFVPWSRFIYEEAQAFVQRRNIKNQDDLRKRRKEVRAKIKEKQRLSQDEISLLYHVPANPRQFYRDQGWSREDFFAREWLPVNEAQTLVQELGIVSVFELWNRRKTDTRLRNIPSHPGQIYNVDYLTFFGLKEVSPSPEQLEKTVRANDLFLRLVYSVSDLLPGMYSPKELKKAMAKAHLRKLAIESVSKNNL